MTDRHLAVVPEWEPPAIVWAPPSPTCYGCCGTGWLVGFGNKPRTVQCPCTQHSRDCDPESCDDSCPTRRAIKAGHL